MAAKSRVIGARLHPGNEAERAALEIYDGYIAKKIKAREIITNALLKLDGVNLERFRAPEERRTDLDVQLLDMKAILDNLMSQVETIQTGVSAAPDWNGDFARIQNGIAAIQQRQDDQLKELLAAMLQLRRVDPEGFRSFANSSDDEDGGELSPTFIANAGKALKPSFRQKNTGGDD